MSDATPKTLLTIRITDQISADMVHAASLPAHRRDVFNVHFPEDAQDLLINAGEAALNLRQAEQDALNESASAQTLRRTNSAGSLLEPPPPSYAPELSPIKPGSSSQQDGSTEGWDEAKSMATLGNLPPELKALIVEKVVEMMNEEVEADEEGFEDVDTDDEEEGIEPEEDADDAVPQTEEERQKAQDRFFEQLGLGGGDGDPEEDSKKLEKLGFKNEGEGSEDFDEELSPLLALCLVNREFAALTFPFIWKELDLSNNDTASLPFLLTDILPRHGRHVERILITRSDHDTYYLNVGEELSSVRESILALVLLQLPNLLSIELDLSDCPTRPSIVKPDATTWMFKNSFVTDALRLTGAGLEDLTLEASDIQDDNCDEEYLANLLKSFPNLLRLHLDGLSLKGTRNGEREIDEDGFPVVREEEDDDATPASAPTSGADGERTKTGRDQLIDVVTSMDRLETLVVDGADFVNDQFARSEFKSSLVVLGLSSCDDLSLPAFIDLIGRHAKTLQTLDIDEVPHTNSERDNKKYLGRPFPFALPKLRTLVVSTFHERPFLHLFDLCGIEELSIKFCPAIEYGDWESFIVSHEKTLKKVVVEGDAQLTQAQTESLEVFCLAKKIDCTIEDPETDSDEDYSDEEDADVGDWTDDDDGIEDDDDEDDF
ncbi:hypothetical protein MNV49_005844 [Pseudohyphozyma bogoriensis]|nr:hypothetical protein MNV49_005844 [Pseudohyphozyma bogoriensis]